MPRLDKDFKLCVFTTKQIHIFVLLARYTDLKITERQCSFIDILEVGKQNIK